MSKITDTPYKSEIGARKDRKYATKEEAYEAHKKRVRDWQKKNPEKHRAYVKKYHSKPEILERDSIQAKARYAALTSEQLEVRRAKQREFYAANRDRIRASQTARYHARKALDENSTT
jgi:hypothetical protein